MNITLTKQDLNRFLAIRLILMKHMYLPKTRLVDYTRSYTIGPFNKGVSDINKFAVEDRDIFTVVQKLVNIGWLATFTQSGHTYYKITGHN